jgi:tripartite-type tricarboxylate transporter receptor subunit TctC
MREVGFATLETAGWQGLLGPAGMPRDVVAKLATELGRVLARPDVQKKFLDAGTPVTLRGPEEFAAFVRAENQRWLPVIKASGAKIE